MTINRRTLIKRMSVGGVIALAGCVGGPDDSEDGEDEQTGDDTETGDGGESDGGDGEMQAEVDIGMVYATGGLGDGSFNDQAQQGLFDAEEEFGVNYQEAQPDEVPEFESFQRQFAQSTDPDYNLICCIGFLQSDGLTATSQEFPDQEFMIVDSVVDQPNVASYVFEEQEGSFLAGQLAGLLSTREFEAGASVTAADSNTVGFVGGVESDLIRTFQAGFTAGVNHADESVEVITNYVGDFNDPQGGQSAANTMYNNGADIIYHAAGNTGTGVFQAAQEQGRFAIGVDRDQSVTRDSFQDVILASMVKRVDTAVYEAVESVVESELTTGTVTSLGLESEGVGLVYGQQLGDAVPGDVQTAVSDSRQAIIDGELSVPTDPDDV